MRRRGTRDALYATMFRHAGHQRLAERELGNWRQKRERAVGVQAQTKLS